MAKTYQEINKKIKDGKVVVVTAEEIIDIVSVIMICVFKFIVINYNGYINCINS